MNAKLAYCLGIGLALGVATMNLPPALDSLAAHYGIDYLKLSVLISALFWSHALLQLPGGMLADRIGLNRSLGLGLGLVVLGNLAGTYSGPLSWALCSRVVAGMGTGITYAGAIKLAALKAPSGRAGVGQAYFGGSLAVGSIASFLVLPELSAMDWRWPFLLPGLACLSLMPWAFFLPSYRQVSEQSQLRNLYSILASPAPWALGLLHSLSWGSIITLGSWMPALMADSVNSLDTAQFAWMGAAAMALSGVARALGGYALSKIHPARVALGSMLAAAVIYLALYAAQGPVAIGCLLLLAVITVSANFAAIFQMAYQFSTTALLGGTLGLVNLVANLGAIFLTILLGWAKNSSGQFTEAFLVMSLMAVVVFAASGVLLRKASNK